MSEIHYHEPARGVSAVDGTNKAKIERAAVWLFSEHGVDGVSTKSIAQKAGVSEGLLYRYFKNKDTLARELMRAIHIRLTEMILAAAAREEGLADQVSFIVRHYCEIADDDWTLFRYHILHLHHFPSFSEGPEDGSWPASPHAAAVKLLSSAMEGGAIPKSDANVLAAMALGVVLQPAQAKVLGAIDGPLSAHIEVFEQGVFAVLGLGSAEKKEGASS